MGNRSVMLDVRLLAAVLPAVAVLSCVGPTLTADQYRARVEQTAKSMTGIVVTAQHTGRLDADGRLLPTVAETLITESEQDADSARSDIESREPPDAESDALRKQITPPVEQAKSLITDLRIAVRHDDQAAERAIADALSGPLNSLQALQ